MASCALLETARLGEPRAAPAAVGPAPAWPGSERARPVPQGATSEEVWDRPRECFDGGFGPKNMLGISCIVFSEVGNDRGAEQEEHATPSSDASQLIKTHEII